MNKTTFFNKTLTIAILQDKGGAGRTTLSTNLARGLRLRDLEVLLVDSDPLGSSRDWNQRNGGTLLPVVGLDRDSLANDIKGIKAGYDIVIIDGAPNCLSLTSAAITVSDIILIPVQPSPYDIWATDPLVQLIKIRQEINYGKPKASFILSRVIKNTHLSKDVREALSAYDFPIFDSYTSQCVVYPSTAQEGKTVFDTKLNQAKFEINLIIDELLRRYIYGFKSEN